VREEPRARASAYVRGLLAGLERKNGWTLAEHAGAVSPDGMQRLLRTADWDIEGVRDDVRDYVLEHRPGPLPGPHLAGLVRPHHPGHARLAYLAATRAREHHDHKLDQALDQALNSEKGELPPAANG
jgi:hypothetical protein